MPVQTATVQKRIAILPFRNLLGENDTPTTLAGFTEDLIANFSRFIGISVISYYSTAHIKDLADKSSIDKLKADYLISGSFKKIQNRIRISVQLINSVSEQVVFAKDYDLLPDEIQDTQDEILQQLVSTLQQKIDYDILSHSYKKNHTDLAAYENYLVGMNLLKKGSVEKDEEARKYFNKALQIDSQYAPAYTGLSLSHFNEWSCRLWDRWEVSKNGAHKYALKAIEVDQDDYNALAILGKTYLFKGDYEKAEHCIRKSLRMNPNDASNLLQVGFGLMYLGYPKESAKLYEKARLLNPFHEDVYFAYGSNFYFECGDFKKSIELGNKIAADSCWIDFPAFMAAAFYYLHDYESMWRYWKIFLQQFEKSIFTNQLPLEQEAIQWQIMVNPYRGQTQLQEFWEYIKTSYHVDIPTQSDSDGIGAFITREGETCKLVYQGKTLRLKCSKGLEDLILLVSEPEKEFHCLELMGGTNQNSHKIELLDEKGKKNYKERLNDLQIELEEAESMSYYERAEQLNKEYDAIVNQLSGALGLGGRSRETGSSVEKARSAVTWRIRNTIKKINELHPPLGKHLSNSVQTGTFCGYKPEMEIHWEITE